MLQRICNLEARIRGVNEHALNQINSSWFLVRGRKVYLCSMWTPHVIDVWKEHRQVHTRRIDEVYLVRVGQLCKCLTKHKRLLRLARMEEKRTGQFSGVGDPRAWKMLHARPMSPREPSNNE